LGIGEGLDRNVGRDVSRDIAYLRSVVAEIWL